jgi:hypothetical protein
MRLKIRGKTWTLRDAKIKAFGQCTKSELLIEVRPGQGQQERMDTILHEVIHAFDPKMRHDKVELLAGTLTAALWKDGYRRYGK